MSEPFITPKEAAQHLSVSAKTVSSWARHKQIPAYNISQGTGAAACWRFKLSELEKWMEGQKTGRAA